MATIGVIAITLTALCVPNHNHAHLHLDLNSGVKERDLVMEVGDMIEPLSDDDIEGFMRVLLKLGGQGRTKAQMKTALEVGVTVTIST